MSHGEPERSYGIGSSKTSRSLINHLLGDAAQVDLGRQASGKLAPVTKFLRVGN